MLLAGGQGSRLYALTSKIAKPAVTFGAKYRIIDFTLSNCVNSGIHTVGVLTQYQPLILNEYIGSGEPWDLDRSNSGVHMLPPYQAKNGADWYSGTANAIYQNMNFISKYDPENVLILSGDHIYRIDYSKMLDYHISKNADITISVIQVSLEEAPRFGILSADADGRVTAFEEKPKKPKSDTASMGIYIFKTWELFEQLIANEKDAASGKDFGKNIIPTMLREKRAVYAYPFSGYWKDVGTVTSLWEANMDLLGTSPAFDMERHDEKIYTRDQMLPPQYVARDATVNNSLITSGCEIYGKVINSVLSEGVIVHEGAVVRDSVIMKNAVIGAGTVINFGVIDENVQIGRNVKIGDEKSNRQNIALVGRDYILKDGSVVPSGAVVEL
jgi:glucose-1-phosphate adenylyltransferase